VGHPRRLLRFCVAALFVLEPALAQSKTQKVFLLEDVGSDQWCAYDSESTWDATVQRLQAMTVGTLTYADDHLSRIDVTETDESGDWMVYDHYFLDGRGRLVKLLRLINVLPGDRSVEQTYVISAGKAIKTKRTDKELSTGKPMVSPESVWLPNLPIKTKTTMFPFSALLARPDFREAAKVCVRTRSTQ